MAAGDLVIPLGASPERPTLDLTATLGQGDGFARVLERAGVGGSEARRVASLVANEVPLSAIPPGTLMQITLGRRTNRNMARPLDALKFRARLDLSLSFSRIGNGLILDRLPIAVDRMPLRIQGLVGESLYRSARAAGAPAKSVEAYIKAIASKLSLANDIDASSRFDIVVEQARAETGEIEYGKLLYAGLERSGRKTQLLQWTIGNRTEWFEASGVGQRRGGMAQPIENGRITSGFGMRFHPILGYSRFHQGIDFGAVRGTPIRAVTDGIVAFAGRNGGYGNHIRLKHNGGLASSYSHMSNFAVGAGARVLQGQVIGYVGSTGMSTGPHLHFEVYRGGRPVSPRSVSFESASLLSGRELEAFRGRIAAMEAIPLNGAR
jgi:murein DD-endopeptidase MepM/ murein hydrolase activator NlpD